VSNISYGTCQTILTEDLCMRRAQNDPEFIKNVITVNETRIYSYDTETKRQSLQ